MVGNPTFSIVDDAGGRFAISGNTVVVAGPLDYELNSSHTIIVATRGTTPRVANQSVTIDVLDVDDPAITITNSTIAETAPFSTAVGTLGIIFSTGTPVFTMVDDAGGKFRIAGNTLFTNSALNYEEASSHVVTVAVTGATPAPGNRNFTITVTDVVKSILLSNTVISEGIDPGDTIGELSVWEGTGTYTFTVIADPSNLFTVDSADLEKEGLLDLDIATSHSVTIRADNGAGDVIDQEFIISVVA